MMRQITAILMETAEAEQLVAHVRPGGSSRPPAVVYPAGCIYQQADHATGTVGGSFCGQPIAADVPHGWLCWKHFQWSRPPQEIAYAHVP